MSIGFSEKLSETVRRFPCVYDKTNKLFKDKNANWNAWANVAEERFLETGMVLNRSSHAEVFSRKSALRNFAKFTGKHLCQGLFVNKVADLRPAVLSKKKLWHRCFPVNFVKFLTEGLYDKIFLSTVSFQHLIHIYGCKM